MNETEQSETSETNSSSDDESEAESSELDEEFCTQRRTKCVTQMSSIEKEFNDLRERLYRERQIQVTTKLKEVDLGTSTEYLQRLKALENEKQRKIRVIEAMKVFRLESLKQILKAEYYCNDRNLKNEKLLLRERIHADLDDRIHKLEEDRDNIDVELMQGSLKTEDFHSSSSSKDKWKKKEGSHASSQFNRRKKKPATVTGPYIVYMLKETDIMDDWAAIKRAISIRDRKHKRDLKSIRRRSSHTCRYEDGKFYYNGKCFQRGQKVLIRGGEKSYSGEIDILSHAAVFIHQGNGVKSKVNVHHLQRGTYTIHPR